MTGGFQLRDDELHVLHVLSDDSNGDNTGDDRVLADRLRRQ